MSTVTQNRKVLEHLQRFGSITSREAFIAYDITRLSARIWDLRHEGHPIGSEMIKTNGGYCSKYFLVPENYAVIKKATTRANGIIAKSES